MSAAVVLMLLFCWIGNGLCDMGMPAKLSQTRPEQSWTLDNYETTGSADCFGLKDAACSQQNEGMEKGCKALAGDVTCGLVQSACEEQYCTPFCLRDTWKVTVKGYDTFLKNVQTGQDNTRYFEQVGESLSAQVMGYGCEQKFKCCKKGAYIKDWVEDMSYKARATMTNLQSLPGCHAPYGNPMIQEDLCKKCKESVKVEATNTKCVQFGSMKLFAMNQGSQSEVKGLGAADMEKEQDEAAFLEIMHRNMEKSQQLLHSTMGTEWVKKRCMAVAKEIEGAFAGVKSEMESGKLCACMGCCVPDLDKNPDGDCPYPLTVEARRR